MTGYPGKYLCFQILVQRCLDHWQARLNKIELTCLQGDQDFMWDVDFNVISVAPESGCLFTS